MVINGVALLRYAPIKDMLINKVTAHGVSYGLTEVGYDIRLKQDVTLLPHYRSPRWEISEVGKPPEGGNGSLVLASAVEEFAMPENLVGIVHDKSTWARKGLSVFNTVIEPGWRGFLTLELVYHGQEDLHIPAGSGIAQVIFHETMLPAAYNGKYQDQEDRPIGARHG